MRNLLAIALVVAALPSLARAEAPKVGDKAPDFELQGSDGQKYSLAQFAGKQAVVIAWFPKAFTGGCTAECKDMRASSSDLRKFDVAYFTASVDEPQKNAEFAKSLELDFPILSDPSKKTATAYGVLRPDGSVTNRWTFYIGADGKIKAIDQQVNAKQAGQDMAKKLSELGVPKK